MRRNRDMKVERLGSESPAKRLTGGQPRRARNGLLVRKHGLSSPGLSVYTVGQKSLVEPVSRVSMAITAAHNLHDDIATRPSRMRGAKEEIQQLQ